MQKSLHKLLQHESYDKIQKDVDDLFTRRRTGHLSYLPYGEPNAKDDTVKGASYWNELYHHPSYYVVREDDAILRDQVLPYISSNVRKESLVDLGPGDQESILAKSVPLARYLEVQNYIAVDMAQQYAESAAYSVSQELSVQGFGDVGDFMDSAINPLTRNGLIFIGGSTISGISVEQDVKSPILHLSRTLSRIRNISLGQTDVLISFDANQNGTELYSSYASEEMKMLIEDIPRRIVRDTDYSFDPSLFCYEGKWIAEECRFAHLLKAKENLEIVQKERVLKVRKGEVFHALNSFKFPVEMINKAAKNAGLKTTKTWTQTDRVHYMLLKTRSS